MLLVTRSNEPHDAVQTTPAGHGQVPPKRVAERLTDSHNPIKTKCETICNGLQSRRMANVGTIRDLARSFTPGSGFLLNGKQGLALWGRMLDLAWLGNQIHDSRVTRIHCNLANENIIVPNYPPGFHIVDFACDNALNSPLVGRVEPTQSLHPSHETVNHDLSCQVSRNVLSPSHMRSQTYAGLHALLEDEVPTRPRPNALREIYFNKIISYLRLTTRIIRRSASRTLGCFACTIVLLDRRAEDWAEA